MSTLARNSEDLMENGGDGGCIVTSYFHGIGHPPKLSYIYDLRGYCHTRIGSERIYESKPLHKCA
jgi:hypothetical protein